MNPFLIRDLAYRADCGVNITRFLGVMLPRTGGKFDIAVQNAKLDRPGP